MNCKRVEVEVVEVRGVRVIWVIGVTIVISTIMTLLRKQQNSPLLTTLILIKKQILEKITRP